MASTKPEKNNGHSDTWTVEGDADVWREFSAPTSDERFCQAWLGLLCRQLQGISAGVVLFQSTEENTFLPVAVWPDARGDLSYLGKVAERALLERRGVVHQDSEGELKDQNIHVAYPVEVSGNMVGAVVLEGDSRTEAQVHALLRQLHWGIAWLHDLYGRRELVDSQEKCEQIGSVMEVMATALRQGRLQQVLFDISNHVAQYLQCSRVAIGLVKGHSIRVTALSNAAWIEKNATTIRAYKSAMLDAYDQMDNISYQVPVELSTASVAEKVSSHAHLAEESGAVSILSIPLMMGAECVAVITLENDKAAFTDEERTWIDTLASLLPSVIDQKCRAERGYLAHIRDDFTLVSERLLGAKYLIWKFSALLLLALVMTFSLMEVDYRISAKTVIEGELQLAAVAPFDGFIKSSYVRAGDSVKEGQILCLLDDSKLKLEQQKWGSEREQYSRKLREATANHKVADVQILTAQLKQAEAQYDLATHRLDHVEVKAPFDGIIISGDLSQLIGSPIELGKELFEIAPLDAYRVILQVDESDMRHIKLGQQGKLMISGIIGEPVSLSISKITPMATARDGKNFFRVEAQLEKGFTNLRPGMEGVGKVRVGEFGLWWVLTHSFTDWLRLSLWKWLP